MARTRSHEQLLAQLFAVKPRDVETLGLDPSAARRSLDAMAPPLPIGLDVREVALSTPHGPTLPCEWVVPAGGDASPRRVLYLHGGGYVAGSRRSHRGIVSRLARATGAPVFVPEYRLAPEHRFPAAVDDALAALAYASTSAPDGSESPPVRLAIVGDSAGGGLALATLVAARDRGRTLPDACVLLSPWTDLAATGSSVVERDALDPVIPGALLERWARLYVGDADPRTPLASPLYAALHGLPRMLVQVGDQEVLLDDSTRLAERARSAGVDVTLEVWPDMFHVFQAFAGALPEGREAIARIASFLAA